MHYGNINNRPWKDKRNFRRRSTDITTNHNDDDKPTEIYVDTNYKHYNTTIRRTENGLQLRTTDSPTKKQKPPLPERKYKQEQFRKEPFKIEPLETIKRKQKPNATTTTYHTITRLSVFGAQCNIY